MVGAYSQFPNATSAFGGVVPALPTTQAEADDFGQRILTAMQGLLEAARGPIGPRGQVAHNAFMLSGLLGVAYAAEPILMNPWRAQITPVWQQIYDLHLNSPYSSIESMGPPGLPLDPLESELVATYWADRGWLTEVPAVTAPILTPPVTDVAITTTGGTQTTAAGATSFFEGYGLYIAAACVALLFFANSKG